VVLLLVGAKLAIMVVKSCRFQALGTYAITYLGTTVGTARAPVQDAKDLTLCLYEYYSSARTCVVDHRPTE